jgi:hypothetical protein
MPAPLMVGVSAASASTSSAAYALRAATRETSTGGRASARCAQSAAYPAVNNTGGEAAYCASNDPNGDSNGSVPSQDQGTTGTRWYEGCMAAIANPSSPASKGYYQAGYQYGQDVAVSGESEIESDGGARAFCSSQSGGGPDAWISGCVAAINAS